MSGLSLFSLTASDGYTPSECDRIEDLLDVDLHVRRGVGAALQIGGRLTRHLRAVTSLRTEQLISVRLQLLQRRTPQTGSLLLSQATFGSDDGTELVDLRFFERFLFVGERLLQLSDLLGELLCFGLRCVLELLHPGFRLGEFVLGRLVCLDQRVVVRQPSRRRFGFRFGVRRLLRFGSSFDSGLFSHWVFSLFPFRVVGWVPLRHPGRGVRVRRGEAQEGVIPPYRPPRTSSGGTPRGAAGNCSGHRSSSPSTPTQDQLSLSTGHGSKGHGTRGPGQATRYPT